MTKIYMVRHKTTKLFSMGGMSAKFNRTGKCWRSEGALKSHFTFYLGGWNANVTRDRRAQISQWEIIEFTILDLMGPLLSVDIWDASILADRPAKK